MNKYNFGWFLKGFAFLAILLIAGIAICGVQLSLAQDSGTDDDRTAVDIGPVEQNSTSSDKSSAVIPEEVLLNNTSALDPNAPVTVGNSINDKDIAAGRPEAIPPGWRANFLFVDGAAFKPRNSTYTYAEASSGGCIYAVANPSGIYNVDLQLPDGAIIDIVRLFWYDTSASDTVLFLTHYDFEGDYTDVGYVLSSGNTGYGNDAFNPADYVVDNYYHSMLLNWRPVAAGSTLQICGVRIRYWTPAPGVSLPIVNK